MEPTRAQTCKPLFEFATCKLNFSSLEVWTGDQHLCHSLKQYCSSQSVAVSKLSILEVRWPEGQGVLYFLWPQYQKGGSLKAISEEAIVLLLWFIFINSEGFDLPFLGDEKFIMPYLNGGEGGLLILIGMTELILKEDYILKTRIHLELSFVFKARGDLVTCSKPG